MTASTVISGVHVDRSSPVPLYFQVAQSLQELITSGVLPPGSRFENEILLADQLGISRPTMRRAIEYLVQRGLVVRRRGVGTEVVQPRVHRPVELSSLFDDLTASGQHPHTQVLRLERRAVADVTADIADLELAGTDEVWVVERLRSVGGEPIALMHNHVPTAHLELTREALSRTGLYELMRAAGMSFKTASQTIGARAASTSMSELLHVRRGAPLLTMRRTAFDAAGRPLELGSHVYRADRYTFDVTLSTP